MFKQLFEYFLYTALVFFTILMVKISIPYFSFSTDVAFLRIKQQYISNLFWLAAFYVHALTATFTLFAGFTQFSNSFRIFRPRIHRTLGYLYIGTILFLAAPSGFVLGLYANGGLSSRIGFCLLAYLWFYFTFTAFVAAKNHKIKRHQKFMIRSYALTLSAITLRLWKYGLANTVVPDPMDLYQLVTWLGFIPNIIVAEYIIHRINQSKSRE